MAIGDAYTAGWPEVGSRIVPVVETQGEFTREGYYSSTSFAWLLSRYPSPDTGRKRRQGHLNSAFCDGQVEGSKVERLFFSKKVEDLRLWNIDNEPHRERLIITK